MKMADGDVVPPNVSTIFSRLVKLVPSEKVFAGLDLKLEENDILLSAGSKSGTTWVQQILHGLRTGGSMDYDDINAVIPFLEYAVMGGAGDVETRQYMPRMFKTHALAGDCPSANKVIVVTRDVEDAALSYYHYFQNWIFEPGELTMEEFIEWFYIYKYPVDSMGFNADQMRHLASWYPHRKDKNVLWLHYEDLKADLKKCIQLISDFTDLGVGNQELLDLVEKQASLDFMKKHDSKFDSHMFKIARNEIAGLKKDAGLDKSKNAGKVRAGKVNESKHAFSQEAHEKMDRKWKELLQPITGYDSYAQMRDAVNKELGRTFPA